MIVEPGEGDFYKVTRPHAQVVKALKTVVPPLYRYFKDTSWYVHKDYLDGIVQLAEKHQKVDRVNISLEQAYSVLYLTTQAPMTIVSTVWKALAKEHHPDRGGDPEEFKKITQAYELIQDHERTR